MPRATLVVGVGLLLLLLVGPAGPLAHPAPAAPHRVALSPVWDGPRPVPPTRLAHPALGGGTAEQIVYANDSAFAPATGVETNITAFTPISMPQLSSYQVSLEVVLGGLEVVFGIFQNTGHAPTAFRAEFTNRTDNYTALAYWTNLTLQVGTSYGFALLRGTGTNWTLSINGQPFGGSAANATVDCGVTALTWDHGLSFAVNVAYGPSTYVPASVTVPLAFATYRGGGWYLPHQGLASEIGSAGTPWGIQGRLQHPTMAPGEIASGPLIAPVANNTSMWRGGPVPVNVHLTLSDPAPPAFASVSLDSVVTDANGTPLPSVPLSFSDSNDSPFFPALILTNASGGALSAFTAPNASVPGVDTIHVSIAELGFNGSAVGSVSISPATELRVVAQSAPTRLVPGGSASFEFDLRTIANAPAAGVSVLFTLAGPGSVEPVAAASAADGSIPVTVSSDGQLAPLTVIAKVAAPGYWGHGSVEVQVSPTPPTLYDRLQPYFLPLGGAVVVAAFLLFVWWRRRPRGELPPLTLPAYRWRGRGPKPPYP
jgi:hypothetical protein